MPISEDPKPRSFIVSLSPEKRAIVTIEIEEDTSLPAPLEKNQWEPVHPSHSEIRQSIAALHIAQDLGRHEIAWRRKTTPLEPQEIKKIREFVQGKLGIPAKFYINP